MRLKMLSLLLLLLGTVAGLNGQNLQAMRGKVPGGYDFWLCTPAGYDPQQPQPVVIFLHGRSLCGHNLNQVLRYGTIDAIKRGMPVPAICLAPQNPGGAWSPRKVIDMLTWVEQHYRIDTTRVYLLGMSLGGYGTMDVAGTYPDKFAAAMALCGGCYLKNMDGLGRLPFWILHGTADNAVPISASRRVVTYLHDAGLDTRLRYDWLPGASHSALARAFYLKDTYDWLFSHSTADPDREVNRYVDIDNDILRQAYSELRELRNLVDEGD